MLDAGVFVFVVNEEAPLPVPFALSLTGIGVIVGCLMGWAVGRTVSVRSGTSEVGRARALTGALSIMGEGGLASARPLPDATGVL